MFEQRTLESLIRERVPVRPIATGWDVLKCRLCNDYKERAGFKFEDGHIRYNCWNCSTASNYVEFSGRISEKFRKILNAYNITNDEISSIVNVSFFHPNEKKDESVTLERLNKISTITPTITLPPKCFRLGYSDNFLEYQEKLIGYLLSRKVDVLKYSFFFSLEERFIDHVIIPFYRNGHLIYWQSRSTKGDVKKRYDNSPVNRDAIIFNVDQLSSHSRLPLLVTEGAFDAMMFDGVAILGSSLSEAKIALLSKSTRKLVFVIDKDKNGKHLAEQALHNGWEITFPPTGVKDVNASVQRFGFAWTALQLTENIAKDKSQALLSINFNCMGKS